MSDRRSREENQAVVDDAEGPAPEAPSEEDAGHRIGRSARGPRQIPWRGWIQVLARVVRRNAESRMGLIAAGVAFYSLLALFPAIAAMISVYGLVADPAQVDRQFATVAEILPQEVYAMISGQMREVAAGSGDALGVGLVGALLVSVWSSTKGTKSLIEALNVAYEEDERRGLLHFNLFALAFTGFFVVLGVVAIGAVVAIPVVLSVIGLGAVVETLMQWLRWPLLAALLLFTLAIVYRYGPCRRKARWNWVSWGSASAVLLWLAASGLFSFYVANFGAYNATYGSIGAVVIMLMWLFISAFVILAGALLNAEVERQTALDTTGGPDRPMGDRGAYVADHLPGKARS